MADNDIARRGYMNVVRNPKDGVMGSLNRVTSKRYWVVLFKSGRGGQGGRLNLYRNEDQRGEPVKMISLDILRSVDTAEKKKAFVLHLPDEVCMFQCASRAELDDWHRDILTYRGGCASAARGSMSGLPNSPTGGEIYEIVPDDETYRVSLRKSNSIMFSGPCLFEILRDFDRNLFHIAVFTDEKPPRLVVKWQIDHIRQYGSNQMAFKFESGSKSSTGVDWFILDTEPGYAVKIHKAVDYWAKHIVEQVRNMPMGGGSRGRGNTLPQNRGGATTPTSSSSFSSSLPRQNGQSGVYQALTSDTRAVAPVYETAGPSSGGRQKKPKNQSGRAAPPPPLATSSVDSNRALYQPLQRVSSEPGGHETYAGLNPATMEAPPLPPASRGGATATGGGAGAGGGAGGGIRGDFYMQLNPQTRSPAESQHYMGLKDVRT